MDLKLVTLHLVDERSKNMAAVAETADMTIIKDSEILVKVEEALADLIVVSYCADDKKFQGVLLDSTKGNLPFGVFSLHPVFNKDSTASNKEEKLHSVSQRFTYERPEYATNTYQGSKKASSKGKPPPRQKMTVRLRPRKVLCSNCKGICNENSESINMKKRKLSGDNDEEFENAVEKKLCMGSMLIPKLSRLHPSEISDAIRGSKKPAERGESRSLKLEKDCDSNRLTHEVAFVNVSEDLNINCDIKTGDNPKTNETPFDSIFSNAKTIKICFGAGEGTVVKIPPIAGDFNEDSGLCDMTKQSELKAAKKALKRAKKQAKQSTVVRSPKHIGALSPRNNVVDTTTHTETAEKKHKHKVKHKKKNKLQKERDENTSKAAEDESINYFSDIKDHCLKQKLSISLRRISSASNEKQSADMAESESEEWESDTSPEFPETGSEGTAGRHLRVSPGVIVWGKVGGFPWWPGRVLSVTALSKAHVAWYAAKTSSLMSCDSLSPFLEDYKIRFNKKKRGAYKEAVKQATIEAKMLESHTDDPLASPTQSLPTMSPRPINVFSKGIS